MSVEREDVVVVCARLTAPLMLPDNKVGRCCECKWQVQFRPDVPDGRRICLPCASDSIDWSNPELKVETSPRMLEDIVAYFKRKNN